jgi:hypothetical protein
MLSRLDKVLCCAMALCVAGSPVLAVRQLSKHSPRKWCGQIIRVYDDSSNKSTTVTLTGVLTKRPEWGPPGFGENPKTDSRWVAWILKLDYATPIALMDYQAPKKIEKLITVREVQARGVLEYPGGYGELVNQHVAIVGNIRRAEIATDVTDITMDTKWVRVLGKSSATDILRRKKYEMTI